MQIIDLTHTVTPQIPTWTGSCGFHSEIKMDYDKGVRVQQFKLHGSAGTHMDAPGHFFQDGKSIADLDLYKLYVPIRVIDFTEGEANRHYSAESLYTYEDSYGKIHEDEFVIFKTGFESHWENPERYLNKDESGQMRFPSISGEVGKILKERGVSGVGVDTLSPDLPGGAYPVHHHLLGSGKVIVENMCNLEVLPESGSTLVAFPPKIDGATEFPVRAVAFLP